MATLNSVLDTLSISGDSGSRVRIAQPQARVAQSVAAPPMQDVLADLEFTLSDQLAALDKAAEDDKAQAAGEAEPDHRSWRPLRAT